MKKLFSGSEIWETSPRKGDWEEAVNYASISLPWTFDRMHYGPKSQKAVNYRLLHIFIGVLNQTILEQELKKKGYSCKMDWTNYRENDVFDFSIKDKIYDVKTSIIYSEYDKNLKRKSFSLELLIQGRSYSGPFWRDFFPQMVPLTQLTIEAHKDGYIFGVAKTIKDLRKVAPYAGDGGFWCAVPYDKASVFFQKRDLILAREEASTGFSPIVEWQRTQVPLEENLEEITITFFGEWEGKPITEMISLRPGTREEVKSQMSSLSCIRMEHPSSLMATDTITITAKNHFRKFIPKITDPNINLNDHRFSWNVDRNSLVNLQVPKDYVLYWLGHIPYEEFAQRFKDYPSYFIPNPKKSDENTLGRSTKKLIEKLRTLDARRTRAIEKGKKVSWPAFEPLIQENTIKAGLLISSNRPNGKPIGAACYYYPPYALLESAIYVLPSDLYTMDSI